MLLEAAAWLEDAHPGGELPDVLHFGSWFDEEMSDEERDVVVPYVAELAPFDALLDRALERPRMRFDHARGFRTLFPDQAHVVALQRINRVLATRLHLTLERAPFVYRRVDGGVEIEAGAGADPELWGSSLADRAERVDRDLVWEIPEPR